MPPSPRQMPISFLISNVCRHYRFQAHTLLQSLGLHAGQDMFLQRLWEQDGLTQTELVNQLCVQPATINKMVNRMVKNGLIQKRDDLDDKRVVRVYLTERGWALKEPVRQIWNTLEEKILADYTLEEKVLLRRMLLQMLDNLTQET